MSLPDSLPSSWALPVLILSIGLYQMLQYGMRRKDMPPGTERECLCRSAIPLKMNFRASNVSNRGELAANAAQELPSTISEMGFRMWVLISLTCW